MTRSRMRSTSSRVTYEFGPYTLDAEHRLLMHRGLALPLGPRLIETLLVLVENAGRIVSKDKLIERVWPDGYVDESSLLQNIYLLRKALEQWDASAIETLRRRGYRFNPAVVVPDQAQSEHQLPSHNLPSPISEFTGRGEELGAILDLVKEARLVTVLGAGGIGKTRIAIEAGRLARADFSDGVWYIDLTAVQSGVRIASFISGILQIETRSADASSELVLALCEREMLLVLDNCEHVIDEVAELARTLLLACSDIVVLATSRETIRISGERVYRLPPMSTQEGMELFALRASALGANFALDKQNAPVVAAIVEQLDGIPMAIELAAARMASMTPERLLADLDHRFLLLESTDRYRHARHRSLRSLVQWSYDLLDSVLQRSFRCLSVFPGDFDLKSAAMVLADEEARVLESLETLANKSLLQPIASNSPQFRMLETIRLFARDLLASDESLAETHRRYAALLETGVRDASLQGVASTFVGRHRELEEVAELLACERLVTICGAGGIGKTRLAREAVSAVDQHLFVSAEHVETCLALTTLVGDALPVSLLVLDGCDHLREGLLPLLTDWFEDFPHLRILCVCRAPIGHPLERAYVVRALQAEDAARLFAARAPTYASDSSELLIRIGRVPLAIELAAAQADVRRPGEIVAQLDRADLHSPAQSDSRRQTMEAAIDWSYQLLSDAERQVFRKLAVFPGDFGLEGAADVVEALPENVAEMLSSLAGAALIVRTERDSDLRYAMRESLKEYALSALVHEGEFESTIDRYAHYFAAYVVDVNERHRHLPTDEWIAMYVRELENIRGAYNVSIQRDPATAFTIALKTAWFFYKSGRPTEGRERLQAALGAVAPSLAQEIHATALRELSILAVSGAEYRLAAEFARNALERMRGTGCDESALAPYLVTLGNALFETEDYAGSERAYREGVDIARRAGNRVTLSVGAFNLGLLLGQCYGRFDEARDLLEIAREGNQDDLYRIGVLERGLARLAFLAGRPQEAVRHIRDAYAQFARLKNPELCCDARAHEVLCLVADGRPEEARQVFFSIRDEILRDPHPEPVALLLDGLSRLAFSEGAYSEALRCFVAAERHRKARGLMVYPLASQLQTEFLERLSAHTRIPAAGMGSDPRYDALATIRTFA